MTYKHPLFLRGHFQLLKLIGRRKRYTRKSSSKVIDFEDEESLGSQRNETANGYDENEEETSR